MSGGVAAALGEVLDGLEEADGPVIGDLFADLDASETGALDAPSPLSGALTPRRGGGRRPGSKNRRTEAVTAWLLSQHRHPLSVVMEAYSMTPAQLAQSIGLQPDEDGHFANAELLDIFKLQMRMAEACAPYVAQKLPQAVQISGAAGLTVAFAGVSLPARGGGLGGDQVIEGQALSVNLPFKSDSESRNDG